MVEKLKEVSSVPTTNDYAVLVTVKVLPQTSELLIFLKEENTNAVLYKIEGAMDEDFVDVEELKAETLLAKDGSASKALSESWLYVRVLHKAAVAEAQGKTSCVVSGSGGVETDDISDSLDAVKAKTDLIFAAVDSGNLTHAITVAQDTTEQLLVEISKTGTYALSAYFDLDVLEIADEGATVTICLYNKIDGSNYSDKPIATMSYVVGDADYADYPSVEAHMLHGPCKLTIQLGSAVTETRTIAYRYMTRDLGA